MLVHELLWGLVLPVSGLHKGNAGESSGELHRLARREVNGNPLAHWTFASLVEAQYHLGVWPHIDNVQSPSVVERDLDLSGECGHWVLATDRRVADTAPGSLLGRP